MKNRKERNNGHIRSAVCRLAAFMCSLCMIAGGLAVLCGFGMSDTMTAPAAFCMLLSAGGTLAMALGLKGQKRLSDAARRRTAG